MFSKPITANVKTTAKAGTDTMKRGLGKVFTGAYTLTCQVSNQDLSTRDLSTRDLSTRNLSTQDLSTRSPVDWALSHFVSYWYYEEVRVYPLVLLLSLCFYVSLSIRSFVRVFLCSFVYLFLFFLSV